MSVIFADQTAHHTEDAFPAFCPIKSTRVIAGPAPITATKPSESVSARRWHLHLERMALIRQRHKALQTHGLNSLKARLISKQLNRVTAERLRLELAL